MILQKNTYKNIVSIAILIAISIGCYILTHSRYSYSISVENHGEKTIHVHDFQVDSNANFLSVIGNVQPNGRSGSGLYYNKPLERLVINWTYENENKVNTINLNLLLPPEFTPENGKDINIHLYPKTNEAKLSYRIDVDEKDIQWVIIDTEGNILHSLGTGKCP